MLKLKPKPFPLKQLPLQAKISKEEGTDGSKHLQCRKEFQEAIKRYVNALGGGRFTRRRLIYSRPWFLVCGPTGSGKSTLLNSSGLSWIGRYPDEPAANLQWHFSNEAVWIDMAGSLFEDAAAADFKVILETLAWIRPRRPLDGIILVTDCGDLLDTELRHMKNNGGFIKRRIDQVIKELEIELPVYHVFTKADKITGFNTIFSDPMGKWDERTLGASLPASSDETNHKGLFLEELYYVLEWCKKIQVKMLARDQNQADRRMICQFPIVLESLRDKIASIVTTVFKRNDITGGPLFGGFFFTSCQSAGETLQDSDQHVLDVSGTIVSHPLYRFRKRPHDSSQGAAGTIHSYFAAPLFTTIIPNHAAPISTTYLGYKKNIISLSWKLGVAIAVIIIFALFQLSVSHHVRTIEKKVRQDFTTPIAPSTDGIKQLDRLLQHYRDYRRYAGILRPFSMIVTRYDTKNVYSSVKNAFFSSVFTTIVLPCSTLLNDQQTRMTHLPENSPENDFVQLKQLLQTYLAISDSNMSYSGILDKKTVVPVLHHLAATSMFGTPNVTSGLDTILSDVITEYVTALQKDDKLPYRIKADKNLVYAVRKKLVTMFDVNAVYTMVSNDLVTRSKNMELVDIVGRDIPLNLQASVKLNEVYIPAGWNGFVQNKFTEASRQREHIEDWALGGNKNSFSALFNNPQLLYEGMVQRYSDEVKAQWRNFLNSISMEQFITLQIGKERLLQISGVQSDLARLIGKFATWSAGFISADSGAINDPPLVTFTDDMAFLRQFVSSNLPQYLRQFEAVAKGLSKASDENSILDVFTGREGDPLIGVYQLLTFSGIQPLGKEQKDFLEQVLMQPYDRTVDLLTPELARNLTSVWKTVYTWFDGSLNHQYPFTESEKEASFDATVDFFNPVSGTFWKTFNDHFSPYVAKNRSSNYAPCEIAGMLPVRFTVPFLKCLDKADTISHVFFKDGKRTSWKVTILPQLHQVSNAKNLKQANITVGKESVALLTEHGKPVQWPIAGEEQDVVLALTDMLDRNGKLPLQGPWSLMRLLNSSCSYSDNAFQSSFKVQLKTRHNNVIEVSLPASVVISSSSPEPGHPFCTNIFKGFSIPNVIIQK